MLKFLVQGIVGGTCGVAFVRYVIAPLLRGKRSKSRSERTKPNPSEGQATHETPNTNSSTAI